MRGGRKGRRAGEGGREGRKGEKGEMGRWKGEEMRKGEEGRVRERPWVLDNIPPKRKPQLGDCFLQLEVKRLRINVLLRGPHEKKRPSIKLVINDLKY